MPREAEQVLRSLVYGIDLSHHQCNEIDSVVKSKDSLDFIICKATEGLTYTDSKFVRNWQSIKDHDFIRGAYHFYKTGDDPLAQAAFFVQAIMDLEATDLPPIIDFEEGGIDSSLTVDQIQLALLICLKEIEARTQRIPIIYTDINTGNCYLNRSELADYPLWIANYNGKASPSLPLAWKSKGWLIWQRSCTYQLKGQANDFDIFNGDLPHFEAYIRSSRSGE